MTQHHTLEVLSTYGPDLALRFHLESRCFPPALSMLEPCTRAIQHAGAGDYSARVDLPKGCRYRGQTWCTAGALIDNFRLEVFCGGESTCDDQE